MLTRRAILISAMLPGLGLPAAGLGPRAQPAASPAAAGDKAPARVDVPLSEYQELHLGDWTVLVRADAQSSDQMRYRRVLAALRFDLDLVERSVPADALTALKRVRFVVTPETPPRPGLSGRGMCYHDSAGWLTANGFDAQREDTVEICNMSDFLEWRAEQPVMTLHELAHAYHDMIGFDRDDVVAAHAAALQKGLYGNVPYVLSADARRAYAASNAREYFAELSEAYFARNDYFPFTREDLREYDPEGFALIARLWALSAEEIAGARGAKGK
jgi:hypothetical protein